MAELTEEQQRQVTARDQAVRVALFAADAAFLRDRETAEALREVVPATRSRIAVEAALGYLIGQGLITLKDPWPDGFSLMTPEHLRPDVDAYIAEARRSQARTNEEETVLAEQTWWEAQPAPHFTLNADGWLVGAIPPLPTLGESFAAKPPAPPEKDL